MKQIIWIFILTALMIPAGAQELISITTGMQQIVAVMVDSAGENEDLWYGEGCLISKGEAFNDRRLTANLYNLENKKKYDQSSTASLTIRGSGKAGSIALLRKDGIRVPGITKIFQLALRSSSNIIDIRLILEDRGGIEYKLPIFYGERGDGSWFIFQVAVPPFIEQSRGHRAWLDGITFRGFEIMVLDEEPWEVGVETIQGLTDIFVLEAMDMDEVKNDW